MAGLHGHGAAGWRERRDVGHDDLNVVNGLALPVKKK